MWRQLPQSLWLVINEIKKRFNKISTEKKNGKKKVVENQKKPGISIINKKSDQTHLMIGVRTFPVKDDKAIILEVLSGVLRGGMSSRLFSTIREKMGAAYYVYAYPDLYTDHGYFAVGVGAGNKKALDVLKAVLNEFKKLRKIKVGKKELKKVKDYLIGSIAMDLETSDEIALFYGSQRVLNENIKTPKETIKKIEKVTGAQIQKLAKEIFDNKKLNLAIIGPVKNKKEFERALRI